MKTIILASEGSFNDIKKYGNDLLHELEARSDTIVYTKYALDFSDIKELYDDTDKVLLFDPFSHSKEFEELSNKLSSFKKVKFILSPYSFYTGLDLEKLKSLGIKYRNNAGANANSVAQYAIMAMFMLLSRYKQLVKSKDLSDLSILGEELGNKTAGIIGMGNIGVSLLNTLNKLGIKTNYYNRSDKNVTSEKVSFEEVLKNDLVFITIATNSETKKLFSNLNVLLDEKSYLIDVSGMDELYDKNSIIKLINENKLNGYAFEASEDISLFDDSEGNLIKTPHIAWRTKDAEIRTVRDYLNRALKIIEGKESEIDFIV